MTVGQIATVEFKGIELTIQPAKFSDVYKLHRITHVFAFYKARSWKARTASINLTEDRVRKVKVSW